MKKLIFILTMLTAATSYAQQLAFPTAEGYGKHTLGGRGGFVIEVTNLDDDADNPPEGSLRWAFTQGTEVIYIPNYGNYTVKRPITIVFKVSGIIDLKGNELKVDRDKFTIAGQTAPGDGICIRGGKVNFGGSKHFIIRHVRFRMGLLEDGSFIEGGSIGIENASNWIIDHCTFGWSGEENMTTYDNDTTTVQWSIIHEGLYASGHSKGARSYGCQWGGETATYHHNLLAHNVSRTPRFNGSKNHDVNVIYDYVNNVNYNWAKSNSPYGAYIEISNGSWNCNMVNNYYKPGPARPGTSSSDFVQSSYSSAMGTTLIAKWHMSGNYMEGSANADKNDDNYIGLDAGGYESAGIDKSLLISQTPFIVDYPVITESASDAYNSVLEKAGAFPRDTTDRRIIHEVKTGTATGKGTSEQYLNKDGVTFSDNPYYNQAKGIIDNPILAFGDAAYTDYNTYDTITDDDHDGMDDTWETINGLDPTNAEDRNYYVKVGYTCLEVYINSLVGEEIELDLVPNNILDINQPEIIVFLNNRNGQLNIQSNDIITQIIVFDLNGRKLTHHTGFDLKSVDLSKLASSIYTLEIKTVNKQVVRTKVLRVK